MEELTKIAELTEALTSDPKQNGLQDLCSEAASDSVQSKSGGEAEDVFDENAPIIPRTSPEELKARLLASGFPPLYIDRAPSEYVRDDVNRRAMEQVTAFLTNPSNSKGLFICGGVGTGKTWLATLIGRKMAERGEWVSFATLPKLTDALMDITNSERGVLRERYTKNAKFLVIDDIGKETPNKGRLDTLFEVLDTREKNKLLTVFTSNYTLADLCRRITPEKGEGVTAEAVKDRLRCFEAVFLGGESRRGK